MSREDLTAITRLQALLELTSLVGGEESIPSLLDATAQLLADTVGFHGIVINVHRPEWDDFQAGRGGRARADRGGASRRALRPRRVPRGRARRAVRPPWRLLH